MSSRAYRQSDERPLRHPRIERLAEPDIPEKLEVNSGEVSRVKQPLYSAFLLLILIPSIAVRHGFAAPNDGAPNPAGVTQAQARDMLVRATTNASEINFELHRLDARARRVFQSSTSE